MKEDVQSLVDSLVQLWDTGNPDVAKRLYAESAERHDPNLPAPARGPQQIARYVTEVHAGFPDFKLAIKERIAEGDQLATHWTCTGTHKGEFKGIPASGKRVNISGVTLARIEAGKIVEERVYFDRLALLEQLGAVPGAVQSGGQRAG